MAITNDRGYYIDIGAMPLQAYINLQESKDLKYICVVPSKFYNEQKAQKAKNKIVDQVIDYAGVSEEYEDWYRLYCQLQQMKCEYLTTKNEIWLHRMDVIQNKIDKISKPEKSSYDEIIANLDHNIDADKMTVKRFLATIKKRKEEVKRLNKIKK